MSHDSQVIIMFLTGTGDGTIERAGGALAAKWKATSGGAPHFVQKVNPIDVDSGRKFLKCVLPTLGARSRLYIMGHGDWGTQTCGGLDGVKVAEFLARHGLNKKIGLISVTACGGALSNTIMKDVGFVSLANSVNSFTGRLHAELASKHGIRTVCHGRAGDVSVTSVKKPNKGEIGRKATRLYDARDKPIGAHPERHVGHQTESKVRFSWVGEKQKREWVKYDSDPNYDQLARAANIKERWTPHA